MDNPKGARELGLACDDPGKGIEDRSPTDNIDRDTAFQSAMRAAIALGLERVTVGVVTAFGTRAPTAQPRATSVTYTSPAASCVDT